MNKAIIVFSLITFGASVANAQFQSTSPTQFLSGATVGIYMPTNANVRDAFGDHLLQFGFGGVGATNSDLKIGTKLDYISGHDNGNSVTLIPLTLEVEHSLTTDNNAPFAPYIKAFGGYAYESYSITGASSTVIRPTYGAEAGVRLAHHVQLSARYDFFTKVDQFNFSGLLLSVTVGF